jgi:hypothetical protein
MPSDRIKIPNVPDGLGQKVIVIVFNLTKINSS